ncbi:MAG: hypothetical protein KKF24_10385, partial [Gammaproteobacteria bacterium]|nr:hypothetical protein [Gammaproteobacteria bacterium]
SFLKALQLTEGYATGIRLMLDEMAANGSEPPVFSTNEERTFFEVEFKRHPAFEGMGVSPLAEILNKPSFPNPLSEEERSEFAALIPSISLAGIGMIRNLSGKWKYSRKELLLAANLANHSDSVKRHIEPLVLSGILALTNPESPRSPRQKYQLTEYGERLAQYLFEQNITSDDQVND